MIARVDGVKHPFARWRGSCRVGIVVACFCSSAATPRLPETSRNSQAASGGPRAAVLPASIAAYDAVVREGRLFVLEPDQRAVSAYALPARTQVWRRELPGAATGASQLTALEPDRLLVWNQAGTYVLSRSDGVLAARHPPSRAVTRPFLWRNGDACGMNTECRFQPVDCRDARPLGPPVVGRRMEFHDPHGSSGGCYSFGHRPVGATSVVAVFAYSGTDDGAPPTVVGIDRATGAIRYRSTAAACDACGHAALGAVADRDTCWTTNVAGTEIVVRGFVCSTGAPRWVWRTPGTSTSQVVTAHLDAQGPEAPQVFISAPGSATLLDATTGRARWTARLPNSALAIIPGQRCDGGALQIFSYGSVLQLQRSTGAVIATTPLASGARIALQPDGSFRAVDREVPGETSGLSAPLPVHDPVLRVDRGPGSAPAIVRLVPAGQVVLTLPRDGWWIGEVAAGADVWGAVYETAQNAPGRVRFIRVTRAAAP